MYNPGVVDHSGEILGQGIASGLGSFSNLLVKLAQHQEQKDDEEKFIGGQKKLFRPKDDAQAQEMGYESKLAYDNADARQVMGTIHGMMEKATLADYKARQGLQTEQLARLAEERQAATQFNTSVANEPPDTQPMTGDPVNDPNSSGVDILAGLAGQGGQGITGQLQDPNSSGVGIMSALARPRSTDGISMARLQQLAAESNLPIADQLSVSHAQAFRAQAAKAGMPMGSPTYDQDPVTGSRYYRFGKQVLPSGVDPAMIGTPEETGLDPGTYVDRKGKPFTVYDRSNPARDRKLDAGSLLEYEGALTKIDDGIRRWNSRMELSKTDKSVKAPDASVLQDLNERRANVRQAMKAGVGSGAPSGPVKGDAGQGGQGGVDANAIKAAFRAGVLTKEEAVKKLQGMGFK